jgi:uncharacterized protein (TIGR02646 family)
MKAFFNALLFPTDPHERGPDPGPFTERRRYKPHLRREFRRKCVYCRISDGLKGNEGFGVDHYQPKSKFPQLAAAWPNLFYACNVCNAWKGESVSTPERFLPNPCDHRMSDHLQYRGADIETYTPHGGWLVELLRLSERRELREFILSALRMFLEIRSELSGDLKSYEAGLEKSRSKRNSVLLQAAIRDTSEELARIEHHIERLTGEPAHPIVGVPSS